MNPSLHQDITNRLLADYAFKEKQNWLQQGICPSCHKKELYTHAEKPWVLRCGRLDKCGWEGHVKTLYPDLFDNWSKRFAVQPAQPQATADAYLHLARGFELSKIKGWYTQETYYDREAQAGTATVRFTIGQNSYWERLIDQPSRFGKKKARFKPGGSHAGTWWQPPSLSLNAVRELWLVEGIFDAIALDHHNLSAVALLSCNNYPEQELADLANQYTCQTKRPTLIWALDNDRAGQSYTLRWIERARAAGWQCEAAQIPQTNHAKKLDWNDMHQRERLTPSHIETYLYQGALLIAQTAAEKALLIYQHKGLRSFPFEHHNRLYWFELDLERYHKQCDLLDEDSSPLSEAEKREKALTESACVTEIACCHPQVLYYQANTATDESWYYFRINFPHDGQAIKNTFTGSQVASPCEFKKRLLAVAPGAFYTGTGTQLDQYLKTQMANIKIVQTIDHVGYSREHSCYVFGDVAVKDAIIYELNDEDFFDIGRLSIKTLSQSAALHINRELTDYRSDWLDKVWQCFGAKGLVALSFWFGSLFAEQIRSLQKSYPFIEIVGEPGAGKSTLIEFMWKLFGRIDYEGFDPSKSTLAARARNFAQVAGLPVVLIEADREEDAAHARGFDWDELKTAYNGRSVRAVGVKNGGNDTREPPFRGAVVISQNSPVNASEAILQRIVHVYFDRATQTPITRKMAEELEKMPIEQVSGFILKAVKNEAKIMDSFSAKVAYYEQQLQALPEIKSMRIAKNHAQLMALVDALSLVETLSPEQIEITHQYITSMAIARQQAINSDHPVVQEFWEMVEYLDGDIDEPRLNHAINKDFIAINLNQFIQLAADRRQQVPSLTDLKRHLRTSKAYKFMEIKTMRSALRAREPANKFLPAAVKCWVFQR